MKKILAVETSCDDTSVAIVREDGFVICNQVVSQHSVHEPHGGVVPELASRNHAHHLLPLVEQVLEESQCKEIDCLAVTNRPGLVGTLIVGLVTVKTLSLLMNKPYKAVNHIEGHLLSPFLWDKEMEASDLEFPFLSLVVSGGHTHLFKAEEVGKYFLVAKTRDDAAGEVFDKIARHLGFGYPGGPQIDRQAQLAELGRYSFPKTHLKSQDLSFSFSGLKTFTSQLIQKLKLKKQSDLIPSFCADFQEAVVSQIIDRLEQARWQFKQESFSIVGGVSANSHLRKRAQAWAQEKGVKLVLPPLRYCTDNAAMQGLVGLKRLQREKPSPQDLNCYPHSLKEDFLTL